MAGALSDFTFDPSSDLIVCTTSFGQALSDIAAQAPSDATAALQYWWAAVTVLDSYVADWQAIDTSTGAGVVPATQSAVDAMLTAAAPALTASELAALRALGFGDGSQSGGTDVFTYHPGSGALEISARPRRRPARSSVEAGFRLVGAPLHRNLRGQQSLRADPSIKGRNASFAWQHAQRALRKYDSSIIITIPPESNSLLTHFSLLTAL